MCLLCLWVTVLHFDKCSKLYEYSQLTFKVVVSVTKMFCNNLFPSFGNVCKANTVSIRKCSFYLTFDNLY